MGEKGTAAWHALKHSGAAHLVYGHHQDGESLRDDLSRITTATETGELHLPDTGQNAVWDDDKGQWIDAATGQALSNAPDKSSK